MSILFGYTQTHIKRDFVLKSIINPHIFTRYIRAEDGNQECKLQTSRVCCIFQSTQWRIRLQFLVMKLEASGCYAKLCGGMAMDVKSIEAVLTRLGAVNK